MTETDLRASLEVLARASGRDAHDLLRCSAVEALALAEAYRDAAAEKDRTDLDRVTEWLSTVTRVAGPAGTILGAIAAGIGIVVAL
jgi:hypothetical protein